MPRPAAIGKCMLELTSAAEDQFNLGAGGDVFNTAGYLRAIQQLRSRVTS